jgi:hypothetical protein
VEYLYTLLDFIAGIVAAGGLAMLALTHREHTIARLLFILAAAIFAGRWIMWAFTTDVPWWGRGIVGAIVGAFILGALPAVLHWSRTREKAISPPTTVSANTPSINSSKQKIVYRNDNNLVEWR